MNQVLLTLCNMLLNILEIFVLLLLAGGLFSAKLHRLRYVVTILILFLLHVGGLQLLGETLYLRISYLLLVDTGLITIIYRAQFMKAFVLSAIYGAFLAAADSVFLYAFSLITGQQAMVYLQNPYSYYLFCYCAKIIEIFAVLAVRTWLRYPAMASVVTDTVTPGNVDIYQFFSILDLFRGSRCRPAAAFVRYHFSVGKWHDNLFAAVSGAAAERTAKLCCSLPCNQM